VSSNIALGTTRRKYPSTLLVTSGCAWKRVENRVHNVPITKTDPAPDAGVR